MTKIFHLPAYSRAISRTLAAIALISIIVVVSGGVYILSVNSPTQQNPTSTPTPTPINPTPTSTATPTPSPTVTSTPTPSKTPAPATQPTQTPTQPTITPTSSPPTPTPTSPPSPTPTPTPTPSPSPTPSPTPKPTATPTPTPILIPKYSLSEAVSAGYVEANITGYSGLYALQGSSSGPCIRLNIHRLVSYTIEIDVLPTGTLLTTSTAAQNMAVLKLIGLYLYLDYYYPRDRIILDESGWQQYIFEGYCVNFHKSNPTSSTLFTQSGLADANVIKIFNALSQLPSNVTTTGAIQTAVSVVTDDVSYTELQSTWPDCVSEISNARLILEKAGIDISNAQLFK